MLRQGSLQTNVSNTLVKFEKDQLHIKRAVLDKKIKVEKCLNFTIPLIKVGWSCLLYHWIGKNKGF